jgi:multicomponent Na+:H+ antiporter subunit F
LTFVYLVFATFLLATLVASLRRILRGPTRADRMLAAQIFGSTGVAIALVLGEAMQTAGVHDVALVFVLLAAVNAITFAQHGNRRRAAE